MVCITFMGPGEPTPEERHVAVVVHREENGSEKGYFYDTAEEDHGGNGPFDWLMNEAIERAERFARERQLGRVIVRAKLSP